MNLLAITSSFPQSSAPFRGIFIKHTLEALHDQGVNILVIAPRRIFSFSGDPYKSRIAGLRVLRPQYFPFGSMFLHTRFANLYFLTQLSFQRSVFSAFRASDFRPDIVYSHFLLPSGMVCAKLARKYQIPSICNVGEDSFAMHERKLSLSAMRDLVASLTHLITPSHYIAQTLISRYGASSEQVEVIPNGVDTNLFYPRNKAFCRKALGFSENDTILIFVGSFDDRKCPLKTLEAARMIKK